MTTFLLFGDALSNPELRHEIAERVLDSVVFVEHEGERIVVGGIADEHLLSRREDVIDEFWSEHQLGMPELYRDESWPEALLEAELVLRAVKKLGASSVNVPPTFPVHIADYLRNQGVDVVVDAGAWAARRRRKTPWELEGVERAQRAADTAMLVAARMVFDAERTAAGQLRFEGEILTAEWVREAMIAELVMQGAECEDILVHSAEACFLGNEPGAGPILPDRPCIIDCFPRDRKSGAFTDMTRTFVPGTASEETKRLYKHCRAALSIAFDSMKPGSSEAGRAVAGYLESQGWPTLATWQRDEPLREGLMHPLGHGVGLELHEKPTMGVRSDALEVLDVVAVEPGLYLPGTGGVRLEDTVLVTEDGIQHLTDPYPYDLQP